MAKPEMGTKRQCLKCEARFNDLKRPQIVCPMCGAAHDLDAATRSRRTKRVTVTLLEKPAESPAAAAGE